MSDRPMFSSPHDEDFVDDAERDPAEKQTSLTRFGDPDLHSDKRNGLSQAASDCLVKSERLANDFNHATVGAEHLVLAMTLVPSASKQFAIRHLEVNRAFQAAMLALVDMERVTAPPDAKLSYSVDLKNILIEASEMARNRDYQDISVDDILGAFSKLPSSTPASRLIRGQRQETLADEVRKTIQELERSMTQRFDELVKVLSSPSTQTLSKSRPQGWIDSVFGR